MSNVAKEPGPQGEESPITAPDDKKKREYKDFGHDEEKPTRRHLHPSGAFSSHVTPLRSLSP
jgi:H+-transporting ATPase